MSEHIDLLNDYEVIEYTGELIYFGNGQLCKDAETVVDVLIENEQWETIKRLIKRNVKTKWLAQLWHESNSDLDQFRTKVFEL